MDFSFLNGVTLVDTGRIRQPKQYTPEKGLVIRLLSTGEVYPSKELVERFKLEYKTKEEIERYDGGNGFDIVDSKEWSVLSQFPRMIVLGLVPKTEPKVDLFGTCRFNDDGTPKSTVITQGAMSLELIALVKDMGWLTEEQTYVDLELKVDNPIKTQDGLAFIPKTVSRGTNKGEKTYQRREDVTFYPILPTDYKEEVKQEENELIVTN